MRRTSSTEPDAILGMGDGVHRLRSTVGIEAYRKAQVESGSRAMTEDANWPVVVGQLNACLSNMQLRAPIGALLKPALEFVALPTGGVRFSVRIDTFDRDHGHALLGLESSYDLPAGQVLYWLDRWQRDPMKLASYVRGCLLQAMEHEVDESIWLDGRRAFEPKHWGA